MTEITRVPADELPAEKVVAILNRLKRGDAKLRIAREERVSRSTVYKLARGEHISQTRDHPPIHRCKGCGVPIKSRDCLQCVLGQMGLKK